MEDASYFIYAFGSFERLVPWIQMEDQLHGKTQLGLEQMQPKVPQGCLKAKINHMLNFENEFNFSKNFSILIFVKIAISGIIFYC